MKIRRRRHLFSRAAMAAALLWTATVGATSAALAANVEQVLQQAVRSADLGRTDVAMRVVDADTGRVLASSRADESMISASNMKLVTTAAALDVLGPKFVFRTELDLIPPQQTVVGASASASSAKKPALPSLLVRGDGDPAFGDPDLLEKYHLTADDLLDKWTRAVLATGHKHFARLVIDDRVFDRQFAHPDWSRRDRVKHYGAEVAGLNFYDNCLDILPIPTRRGASPRIQVYPPAPFLHTLNHAKTGKKDFFILDRKPGTNLLIFGGTVHHRRTVPFQVTVHDPPTFFGHVFAARLATRGIRVDQVVRPGKEASYPRAKPLHRVQTTLPLVLARMDQDSQNMFASSLFKRMGHELTGRPGSWTNGAAAVRQAMARRLGAASSSFVFADGSGLSRKNRVTARLLVALLISMHKDQTRGPIFQASLARGGINGTLDDRFDHLAPNAAVYGKSGYVSGVSALSGYLVLHRPTTVHTEPDSDSDSDSDPDSVSASNSETSSHPSKSARTNPVRTIAFSFLFNHFKHPLSNRKLKHLQDHLVTLIQDNLSDAVRLGG